MNHAMTTLLDIEARDGLWDRPLLGYPMWSQLRLRAYHHLLGSTRATPARARHAAGSERKRASARDILTKLSRGLRQRDIWILGSTIYRRAERSGNARSIFVKHLEAQLGQRLLFLETNPAHVEPHPDGNVVHLDGVRNAIRGACAGAARLLPRGTADGFLSLDHIGVSPREALHEALYGKVWRRFGRALVRAGRPRAVFVLCAYNQHIPIQLAVREAGIPLVEVQHGVIHESHPGYIFGPSLATRHLPDHLLVFGQRFGQLLDANSPYWQGRWTVAGQPWLMDKVAQLDAHDSEDLVVLFSQNVPAVQTMLRLLALALRPLCGPTTRLVIKPHPAERNPAYEGLSERGVEVAAANADSYELLGRCRVAVSVYSTIAIEALAFSCRSVVLRSPHWFEDIARFVEAGDIQVADGPEDIVAYLRRSAPRQSQSSARALFGVGEPRVDFEQLIASLRSARSAAPAAR